MNDERKVYYERLSCREWQAWGAMYKGAGGFETKIFYK